MTTKLLLQPGHLLPGQLLGAPGEQSGGDVRTGRRGYALGSPGWPSKEPTLFMAIFDNSGSVVAPTGTDPLSNRFEEVAHAFSVVARRGARHELGAVVHFDTPSSGEVGPVPITKYGMVKLRRGLRPPPDGRGSSALLPSVRRAIELAEAYPEHKVTLVVLSDFQLLDPVPAQALAELAAFPGDVHAVVLGGRLPDGVLADRITVTPVRTDDPPGAVARALFASLTTHRRGIQRQTMPSAGEGRDLR